jgi:hypothetical protein
VREIILNYTLYATPIDSIFTIKSNENIHPVVSVQHCHGLLATFVIEFTVPKRMLLLLKLRLSSFKFRHG